jgi:hypothetical protein
VSVLTADELAGWAVNVAGVGAATGALAREDVARGFGSLLAVGVVVAAHKGRGLSGAHVDGDHIRVRQDGVGRLVRVHRLGAHRGHEEGGGAGEKRHRARPDRRHPNFVAGEEGRGRDGIGKGGRAGVSGTAGLCTFCYSRS